MVQQQRLPAEVQTQNSLTNGMYRLLFDVCVRAFGFILLRTTMFSFAHGEFYDGF